MSMEGNPSEISGITVKNVMDSDIDRNTLVLVALHEKNIESALKVLALYDYKNIRVVSFDSDEWSHIRGNWFISNGIIDEKLTFSRQLCNFKMNIYVAQSIYDKEMTKSLSYRDYEIPIQVGKALSSERICNITDEIGNNISEKNRQYCELTALYWIWKNRKADYLGLCHYRRRFDLTPEQIKMIVDDDIEMVVTTPILNLEGVGKRYASDHGEEDWNAMLEVISKMSPDYYEYAIEVQNSNYYFGYNMFIAKYNIFCSYCEWLFKILEECEKRIGQKKDRYQNRYIGFLAERLLLVYIKKNQIRHMIIDKHFYQ